eukprot:tig00020684_g12849.t1
MAETDPMYIPVDLGNMVSAAILGVSVLFDSLSIGGQSRGLSFKSGTHSSDSTDEPVKPDASPGLHLSSNDESEASSGTHTPVRLPSRNPSFFEEEHGAEQSEAKTPDLERTRPGTEPGAASPDAYAGDEEGGAVKDSAADGEAPAEVEGAPPPPAEPVPVWAAEAAGGGPVEGEAAAGPSAQGGAPDRALPGYAEVPEGGGAGLLGSLVEASIEAAGSGHSAGAGAGAGAGREESGRLAASASASASESHFSLVVGPQLPAATASHAAAAAASSHAAAAAAAAAAASDGAPVYGAAWEGSGGARPHLVEPAVAAAVAATSAGSSGGFEFAGSSASGARAPSVNGSAAAAAEAAANRGYEGAQAGTAAAGRAGAGPASPPASPPGEAWDSGSEADFDADGGEFSGPSAPSAHIGRDQLPLWRPVQEREVDLDAIRAALAAGSLPTDFRGPFAYSGPALAPGLELAAVGFGLHPCACACACPAAPAPAPAPASASASAFAAAEAEEAEDAAFGSLADADLPLL